MGGGDRELSGRPEGRAVGRGSCPVGTGSWRHGAERGPPWLPKDSTVCAQFLFPRLSVRTSAGRLRPPEVSAENKSNFLECREEMKDDQIQIQAIYLQFIILSSKSLSRKYRNQRKVFKF